MSRKITNKSSQKEAEILLQKIQLSYKKTLKSLIEVGGYIGRLRQILTRPQFQKSLKSIGMSEIQASRLINLHIRFKDHQTDTVLKSKVSVLYLLASSKANQSEFNRLVEGRSVAIEGQRKTLPNLTVKEAVRLAKPVLRAKRRYAEVSIDRAYITKLMEVVDSTQSILELHQRNKLKNGPFIKLQLKETMSCLKQAVVQLR
ncbi:hypothetical protein BDW_02360 [Bdellovibrio bacteriovorus W]|nr:hypothetical protein BDW_02360 [Bdellovibrio bacteriovorus W]